MNIMSTTASVNTHLPPGLDGTLFEILKHRLWQINDEQGTTVKRVSGSPVASEVQDFNVGIADASGQLIACGMYLLAHVTGLSCVIRNCIDTIGLDRIRPGDMFLTNDPWMGAVHQNDIAIVAPLFFEEELIGWTGSVIHQADVGGPAPGSWNLDAYDVFQEAPRYRFLRIVDGGTLAPEVIETVLTNSRTPSLVELDLRAQVAAANVVRSRMSELLERYGAATIKAVMAGCLNMTEAMLRRRLQELPDGVWKAEAFVDHDGHEDKVYAVRLSMEKRDDTLIFDFRDSDPQAPGLINATRSTLLSAPFSTVLTYLSGGIPWNEGIMRAVEVHTTPGTLVDCNFPAPVASGIVNAAWAAVNACSAALGRLLLVSERWRPETMAVWAGAPYGVNIFGVRDDGVRFGALLGLSGLQGAGARTFADGYDVAGYLQAPRCGAMNVETTEARYPVFHLYRRRAADSGGPGRFRGGQGIETAFTPYEASVVEVITTTFGSDQSGADGLGGGMPGGGANAMLLKDARPLESLRAGGGATTLSEFDIRPEPLPSKARFQIRSGDVFVAVTHGGGGYGDPLDRDPALVAEDVRTGAVSAEWAKRAYGVELAAGSGVPDLDATNRLRSALRERRRAAGSLDAELGDAGPWVAVRWAGRSERFRLSGTIDPATGEAIELRQVRSNGKPSR